MVRIPRNAKAKHGLYVMQCNENIKRHFVCIEPTIIVSSILAQFPPPPLPHLIYFVCDPSTTNLASAPGPLLAQICTPTQTRCLPLFFTQVRTQTSSPTLAEEVNWSDMSVERPRGVERIEEREG
jgi:hypothetical protein